MAQASAEKLKHTGHAEKERVASVPQKEQLARTPESPLPKTNGTERQFKASDHEGERVKVGESRTLAKKRRVRARACSGKGGLHRERRQIPTTTGRASKKSLPRRGRTKHERVSARKSSPGQSAESWFHPYSGQT